MQSPRIIMGNYRLQASLVFFLTVFTNAAFSEEIFTFLDGQYEGISTPQDLGIFRHHCVGNLMKCENGFSVNLWLVPGVGDPFEPHIYYLSSGGQSHYSQGYFVRRNYGKEFEVGVGLGEKIWSGKLYLQEGVMTSVTFTWEQVSGVCLYINGLLVQCIDTSATRLYIPSPVDPFMNITIGMENAEVFSQGGVNGLKVFNISHVDRVYTESEVLNLNLQDYYKVGCSQASLGQTPKGDPLNNEELNEVSSCRKICLSEDKLYAVYKEGGDCKCLTKSEYESFKLDASITEHCAADSWTVYQTTGATQDQTFPLKLEVKTILPSTKSYVRPNETVTFMLFVESSEHVKFEIDFGDGGKKITSADHVDYNWSVEGEYEVNVTAISRVAMETQLVDMSIEWHDEGTAPEVVSVTYGNTDISKQIFAYVTGIGLDKKSCLLDYGDGTMKEYDNEDELIVHDTETHLYNLIGLYSMSFRCENKFGATVDKEDVIVNHPHVEYEFKDKTSDISIPVATSDAAYLSAFVNSEKVEISYTMGNLSIDSSSFESTGEHSVELRAHNKTLYTKIYNLQYQIDKVTIIPDVVYTMVNQPIGLTFEISNGDFLHIHIAYGDGSEEYLYAPDADPTLYLYRNHTYNSLGKYEVIVTVANDISYVRVSHMISIERPIETVVMTTRNTSQIGEPTEFVIEVDMDISPSMPVQVTFDYDDDIIETVTLGTQAATPVPLYHNHTFNTYGIYQVKATVFNNLNRVVLQVLVQVGENITMVDLYSDKMRVKAGEVITFTIHCPFGSPIKMDLDLGNGDTITVNRPEVVEQYVDRIIPSSTTTPDHTELGSGEMEGSGDITDFIRKKRDVVDVVEGSGEVRDEDILSLLPVPIKAPNKDFLVNYTYPTDGVYTVKVRVSNKFGFTESHLCPDIVVAPRDTPEVNCDDFGVKILNTSSEETPLVKVRSNDIILMSESSFDCTINDDSELKVRYTWYTDWKTEDQHWRPELEICITEASDSLLNIDVNTLWYGTYRLQVTASFRAEVNRKKRELALADHSLATLAETRSEYVYLEVIPSPLVAAIQHGDEKRDLTLWDIINVNMTPSYDPDVLHRNKSGMSFHLFCYTKSLKEDMLQKDLDAMHDLSYKVTNNSFNTASLYDAGGCFVKYTKIWMAGFEAVFPGDHASVNDSLVFDMFMTKDTRIARVQAEMRVWTTNISTDNALDAIDALLASGDTSAALLVIDMATDALNVGGSNDSAKEARSEMRGKLINVLGSVADQVNNFDQLDKTAGALNKITEVADEVTEESKSTAAGALGSAANKADSLATDADLSIVSGMATNMVGAAGNVLPFDEEEDEELAPPQSVIQYVPTTMSPNADDLLQPTVPPSLAEPEDVEEPEIPCCEREAGLCEWIEPDCIAVDLDEQKSSPWDDVMCDSIHPDDLSVIRGRYESWKLAAKLDKYERKKNTTTGGWGACLKIGEVVNKKQEKPGEETNIDTPKMKMKLAKVDKNSNSSLGAFSMPADVMSGLAGGAGAMVMDTPNPFTYSDSSANIQGKVMTMAFTNPDGSPKQIKNTEEPFNIWMPGKPDMVPEAGNFTFISSPSGVNMNYHTIHIPANDTGLHMIIRPASPDDVYYVYLKYGDFPNETYFDWKGEVPNTELFTPDDPWKQDQLQYTVFPPQNYTLYNGTYRIGILLKETRVTLEKLGQENNFTYSLRVFLSACKFWDTEKDTWSSEGCQVGNLTTIRETQCLCNHLTSFGSDFVVPPNTIDFNTVFSAEKFLESLPVFTTVIVVILLYIGVMVWARREDKKDLIKWGAAPLEDNLPSDTYHYQMTLYTGVKKHAGTASKVSFILSGDESDSGVRRLFDGKRKEFPTGSIYNFVVSTEQCLGPLNYLRIWHDNSGNGKKKGWFLEQVQVVDIQTGEKFYFLNGQWMAVEEGDGQVERILPVAGLGDLAAFKHLFATSVRKKLSNDHMWFSVLSRPTKSAFTRTQRVSCCVTLLFLTMITNCMFFKADDKVENKRALKIGPFMFTLDQLFISVVSTAIVFPPSLAIVTIFRKAKPKKNAVMQENQSLSKKAKWRSIDPDSMLWSNVKRSRFEKLKDAVSNILRSHQSSKYEADEQPEVKKRTKKKRKGGRTLPHWTNYIAWALVCLSIVASGFFTILYSMEWGREKSLEWLTTFLLSFFQSVIVVQPIKVLLLAAFISCILKKPEDDVEEEEFDELYSPTVKVTDLSASQRDLQELIKQRQLKAADLPPPDTEALKAAREHRLKEIAMATIIKECIVYFLFVLVLFFLSYQTRDGDSFKFANNIKNQFWSPKFTIVTKPDLYWVWLREYFLPTYYSGPYDSGQTLTWREALQIDDRNTIRVGVARLRQVRIKPDSCKIQPMFSSLITHCRPDYNWNDDDTAEYLPGWIKPEHGQKNQSADNSAGGRYCKMMGDELYRSSLQSFSPWTYQDSLELKNAPYAGYLGVYKGGGYTASFKRERGKTEKVLRSLERDEWVDVHTRGLFLEFTLYNANVNLFASVIMLVEFMGTGAAITRAEVKVFRLSSYVGGFGAIVMFMEAVYLCFTLYFFITMIRMLRKQRLKYFKDFWNLLEITTLILSIVAVGMYGVKKISGTLAIKALKNSGSGDYVNFVTISIWDEAFGLVLALVVFTSTIKLIKLLKFNKRMGIMGDTIRLAAKDLKPFIIMFLVYFFAFCMAAYVLFGKQIPSYGTFVGTIESLFAFSLGDFDFYAFQKAQKLLGPLFFFLYVGVVYIGLMGIFLTIIYDSFAQVKSNTENQSNDYEIVDFMIGKLKHMFGMN